MIVIDERFSCERDRWQWLLYELGDGANRDGNPIKVKTITYHRSLTQVASVVIDRCAGECGSMVELLSMLSEGVALLARGLEEQPPQAGKRD